MRERGTVCAPDAARCGFLCPNPPALAGMVAARDACGGRWSSVASAMNFKKKSSAVAMVRGKGVVHVVGSPGGGGAIVAGVEHVCTDEVGDSGLCVVSTEGTDGLAVEQSCSDPVNCCAMFRCLLRWVGGSANVGADGLSEEDATIGENVVGLEDGKQACKHGSVMCREARGGANEELGFAWI